MPRRRTADSPAAVEAGGRAVPSRPGQGTSPKPAPGTRAAALQPLEVVVYLDLMRTQDQLWNDFLPLFRGSGLTHQQYNVLRILRGGGPEGLSCQTIGERMIYRVPDVTRLLDRLEAAGLIERGRTSEDRRVVLSRITAKGRELLDALDEPVLELHRAQVARLSRKELLELQALLAKLRGR